MNETRNNLLFEILSFLWRKIWIIVLVPVLVFAGMYMYYSQKETTYTAEAVTFTGKADKVKLSKIESLKKRYQGELPKELKDSFQITIPKDYYIHFHLTGTDKEQLEKEITKLGESYEKDLLVSYEEQRNFLETSIDNLNELISNTRELSKQFEDKQLDSKERIANVELLAAETELLLEKIDLSNELVLMGPDDQEEGQQEDLREDPELTNVTVTSNTPSPIKQAILPAVLAMQLALIALVLWKYILIALSRNRKGEI